jgi:lysophospholipase L1-like esterase
VYWRRRAVVLLSATSVVALSAVAVVAVNAAINIPRSGGEMGATPTASATIDGVSLKPTPPESTSKKSKQPKEKKKPQSSGSSNTSSVVPPVTEQDEFRPVESPSSATGLWANYPWGSNGQECPHPATSPGAGAGASGSTVIILGDSLIRNAQSAVTAALAQYGIKPIYVCWGGKTLNWGIEQLEVMRSRGLTANCLVVNLGTNDLKGTQANNLADAVSLSTVQQRLTSLLIDASNFRNVFAVDISANLASAPGTMWEVNKAPQAWRSAVADSGIGAVIPWSTKTSSNPALFGSDGIHDSSAGISARALTIAQSISQSCV